MKFMVDFKIFKKEFDELLKKGFEFWAAMDILIEKYGVE